MRIPSANPYTYQPAAGEYSPYGDMSFQQQRIADSKKWTNRASRAALTGVGAIATAGIGPMLFGGGAASGAAGSVNGLPIIPHAGSVASNLAPAAARQGFSIGRLLGSKGAELGAGLFTSIMGNRSASRAQRDANALTERTNAAQMALAERQFNTEQANFAADRADAIRRWEAEEAFRAKQFAAEEEERLEQRRLRDEREARLAPRREMSRQALLRVGQILGWR